MSRLTPPGAVASANGRNRLPALACTTLAIALVAGCGVESDDGSQTPADSASAVEETETTTVTADATTTATEPSETETTEAATTTPIAGDPEQPPAPDIGLVDEGGEVFRPFSEDSPWNTSVATAPIDPRSSELLARAAERITANANPGMATTTQTRDLRDVDLFVNTDDWAVPIVTEENGVPTTMVCRQELCGPDSDRVDTLSIPSEVSPVPGNDGWFSVLDRGTGFGYDLWRARREGTVISYQFIKRWALDGPGYSAPVAEDPVRAVGARGSGLPLFAGVIHPEELEGGRIDHALAIAVPGPSQRAYVQPASVTNGLNVTDSLPEGARIRLREGANLGRLPRGANPRTREILIETLRTFGAIVVDRSQTPTLYARRNADYGTRAADLGAEAAVSELGSGDELDGEGPLRPERREQTPLLRGDELDGIELSDFEVIELPELLSDPPGLEFFAAAEEQADVTPESP